MTNRNVYLVLFLMAGFVLSSNAGADSGSAKGASAAQQPPVISAPPEVQETAPAPEAEKPLLIIRFNANYVHYQNSLMLAVTKAKETKPTVHFRVVSYMPYGSSQSESHRISEKAKENLAAIVQQLGDMGIPTSQISLSAQPDESLAYQEIHIFVD